MSSNMWVIQFDGHKKPYYAKAAFCGGTFDIEEARKFHRKPNITHGKAVEVVVTTTVEIKAHG